MTITKDDIKLLESQRLTDTTDGGGRMTGTEVVDGQVNNLFNDISRLDRTIGRVSLRKTFVSVQTALNEVYAGAHCIVTNPPLDGGVHVTLFSTKEDDDERASARNRIESYTISGPVSRMRLYDRHVSGQRTLQVFQFPTDRLPEVAEVYALSSGEGTGSEFQQFFRILKLTTDLITFSSSAYGAYSLRVLNLEIDSVLQQDFDGYTPDARDDLIDDQYAQDDINRPVLRQTSVADASRYYGVVPLAEVVSENDVDIQVASIFSNIVPSTQAETPVLDVPAALDSAHAVQSGDVDVWLFIENVPDFQSSIAEKTFFLGSGITPGTLRIDGITTGIITGSVTDDGNGGFTNSGRIAGVEINYLLGRVTIRKTIGATVSNLRFAASPAVAISAAAVSKQIEITVQNRQLNYTTFLRPIPAPGTLAVSYRSLGKWYTLNGDTSGGIIPEIAGTGGGTVNYATGSCALTVAFEPDVGSSVLYQWGTGAHYTIRAGDVEPQRPGILIQATAGHCEPDSVVIGWEAGGIAKSVTDDGEGNLTGNGTGVVRYSTGQAYFVPDAYPDANFGISFDYDSGTQVVETFTPTKDGSGFIAMTAGTTPMKAGSVRVSWCTTRTAQVAEQAARAGG